MTTSTIGAAVLVFFVFVLVGTYFFVRLWKRKQNEFDKLRQKNELLAIPRNDLLIAVRERLEGRLRLELENGEGDHLIIYRHSSLILRLESAVVTVTNVSGKLPGGSGDIPRGRVAYEITPSRVEVKRTVFGREQSFGDAEPSELVQLVGYVRDWPAHEK